ncbi:ABC-type transporter Mla maintaining outer membrane lipid asymmetry, periplasmic component MlaD [Mycobacterium numidiamassiliense]|uniref:ABC-type transporter Mla maintaining outer membrane lipid asymmetry, periplasmic component MlaD n=1 Tax=Mycobacterium numidiamassiliense TaxID=1841861 RepID=A0A2U3P358_9MYCO|nr:ABC-type transporter Mla maintaining outer membrane lipid asymmetry, periplasmic component MlaD [Mycobacterium numidiamassiliense]
MGGSAVRLLVGQSAMRTLAGLITVGMVAGVIVVCTMMFRGDFTQTVSITVLSPRAGLVMNPQAKVKLLGVQVGSVASIEERPNAQAALHLAIDPNQLRRIPANVGVAIASTTVFGNKFVELRMPAQPATQRLQAGQVLDASRVTVEFNTLFQQLTSVLSAIEPGKLNATLDAIAMTLNGRGHKIGDAFSDLDALLRRLEPSLPTLERDLQIAPTVVNIYADAATDLLTVTRNTTTLSNTIVSQQQQLDAILISAAGLGDIGADVVGTNSQPLTDVLHAFVPTTDVLSRHHDSIYCGIAGMEPIMDSAPSPLPGVIASLNFGLGVERYRYPSDLPKVAAKGDSHCADIGLPDLPFQGRPKFVVADVGANPWKYGNQGILLNSDWLKQMLYGPIDGPPRNSSQIGQPG